MSDQQIMPCTMCLKHHDQMLMLACVHDPCIDCAAIHFNQASQGSIHQNMYSCAKCGELTELDSSSITELERIFLSIHSRAKKFDYRKGNGGISGGSKSYSSGKKSELFATSMDRHEKEVYPKNESNYRNDKESYSANQYQPYTTPVSRPSYNPASGHKKLPYICQDHADEQISYYCFTCQKPICPECAIHGTHRQHEVQTTRKAIKSIKQTMQTWNGKMGQELNSQNHRREDWRKCMKDMSDEVKRERLNIQEQFNRLRSLISDKEKEFQKVVQNNYQLNSQHVKNSMARVDKNIEKLSNHRKTLGNLVSKDDITVLVEYSSKQEQIHDALEAAETKKEEEDHRKEADYQLMQEQVEQLMGILQAMRLSTSLIKKV